MSAFGQIFGVQSIAGGGTGSSSGNGILGRAPTLVTFGDSIIAQHQSVLGALQYGNATTPMQPGDYKFSCSCGFVERAKILLGQPFNHLANLGLSGDTTAMMLNRISAVLAYKPSFVIMNGGTNDPSGGLGSPVATAQSIANLRQIYQILTQAGIVVIDTTVMPSSAEPQSYITQKTSINAFKLDYAAGNTGVYCFDAAAYVLDTSSLASSYVTFQSSLTKDGTHPNAAGGRVLGIAFANWLRQTGLVNTGLMRRSARNSDGSANGDINNVIFNGFMVQGSGGANGTHSSGTVAQGWSVYGGSSTSITAVNSIVTRASMASAFPNLFNDGVPGYLQHINVSSAGANTESISFQGTASTVPPAGSGPWVYDVEVAVNVNSGSLSQLNSSLFLNLSSGNCSIYTNNNDGASGDLGDTGAGFYGVLRTNPFYVPATFSSITPLVLINTSPSASADLYIGRASLRKLQA